MPKNSSLEPDDSDSLFRLALDLQATLDNLDMVSDLIRAISLAATNQEIPNAHCLAAVCCYVLRDLEAVYKTIQEAVEIAIARSGRS